MSKTNLVWRDTVAEDLRHIDLQEKQRYDCVGIETILTMEEQSPFLGHFARTMVDSEVPLAIVGSFPPVAGIAIPWIVIANEGLQYPERICIGAKRLLQYLAEREGIYRFQSLLNPEHKEAIEFNEWLGFEYEGTMRQAGPDRSDRLLYARLQ